MTEKSLLRMAFSGGLILTSGAIVQAALGFVAQVALMRLLVPEDFGRFAIVLAACSLVQTVLSLRLNVLIIRLPESDLTPDRRRQLQAALVWETLCATVVTLAWLTWNDLISSYTLILVASLAIAQWTNQSSAFFERAMNYPRLILAETGAQLGGHVLAVAIALAGGGAFALYMREAAAAAIRLVVLASQGVIDAPVFRWPEWKPVRRLISDTKGFWTEGVLEGGLARIVVLATGTLAGFHGTGMFAQSQRLATIPHQFAGPVATRLAINVFSRTREPAMRRQLLACACLVVLGAMSLAALVAALTADPLVPLLFGPHWRPAIPLLQAMTGVIAFMTAFELLRAYCFAVGRQRLVVLGRLVQYGVFGSFVIAAVGESNPAATLAWGLSAAYAAGFMTIGATLAARSAICLAWPRGR